MLRFIANEHDKDLAKACLLNLQEIMWGNVEIRGTFLDCNAYWFALPFYDAHAVAGIKSGTPSAASLLGQRRTHAGKKKQLKISSLIPHIVGKSLRTFRSNPFPCWISQLMVDTGNVSKRNALSWSKSSFTWQKKNKHFPPLFSAKRGRCRDTSLAESVNMSDSVMDQHLLRSKLKSSWQLLSFQTRVLMDLLMTLTEVALHLFLPTHAHIALF